MALVVKNLPANAGAIRDVGLILELGGFPGQGQGNPLQYSCLENPMDREAWQAMFHRVTQSQTWMKRLGTQAPRELSSTKKERVTSKWLEEEGKKNEEHKSNTEEWRNGAEVGELKVGVEGMGGVRMGGVQGGKKA